jgi:hypothetical protein
MKPDSVTDPAVTEVNRSAGVLRIGNGHKAAAPMTKNILD